MGQVFFDQVSAVQFYAYNFLCIVGLIWMLRKYKGDLICGLTIFLFFNGVVEDLGGNGGRNAMRIVLLAVSLWQLLKTGAIFTFFRSYKWPAIMSCIWSVYFIVDSVIINHDNALLAFSHLTKFLIPLFVLMLMVNRYQTDQGDESLHRWYWMFGDLIVIQILISIAKLFILGGFLEGWVGSMTGIRGGGAGTSFPLLALMWLALKTDMRLRKKDWLIIIGLLVLGFAAGKRAVWLLFPLLFVFLYIFVYHNNVGKKLVYFALLLPVFFYLALRISPTFNPEREVWGSFDPDYAYNFILTYSGGDDATEGKVTEGKGRLGAVVWFTAQLEGNNEDLWDGNGIEYLTYMDEKDYFNSRKLGGIGGKGSITGIVNTFMTFGLMGVILYLITIITLFSANKSRFNYTLLFVLLFDYIFYNAQSLTGMPLLTMALFLSYFSSHLHDEEKHPQQITEPK